MAQVYFDTLRFVETLEASGVPANQARAISEAVHESRKELDLATKGDISELRATVKREVDDLRVATKHNIEDVRKDIEMIRKDIEMIRKDIIIKIGGMFVVAVGVLAAIIKFPV